MQLDWDWLCVWMRTVSPKSTPGVDCNHANNTLNTIKDRYTHKRRESDSWKQVLVAATASNPTVRLMWVHLPVFADRTRLVVVARMRSPAWISGSKHRRRLCVDHKEPRIHEFRIRRMAAQRNSGGAALQYTFSVNDSIKCNYSKFVPGSQFCPTL